MNILKTTIAFSIALILLSPSQAQNNQDKPTSINGGRGENSFHTCLEVVEEILTTSARFKELTDGLYEAIVKNGGISFGTTLEGSPNPEKDEALNYSETYDFNLHETYKDRMPVIARFTFDPAQRQLYEYDVINDELMVIDFDKELLLEFDKFTNR